MPKILVTGAAGFLGYHLARWLANDPGNVVVCVDNFVRGEQDAAYAKLTRQENVLRYDVDLTDRDQVLRLPDDVEIVYHFAALNGTQNFYERPFEVLRCCTLPTFYLIDKYGASSNLRRFVFASTSETYAATVARFDWPVPTDETVPLTIDNVFNERWSYGASKLHGEVLVINGCRSSGVPFTIIRFHNAYGPRMGDKHVIPDFLNRLKNGVLALYGYEDTRAFIYVDDAVRASVLCANSPALAGEIINVGGAREIKIYDLAQIMLDVVGQQGKIALHPSPVGSVKRRAPSLEKLQRTTGFKEEWRLEDGLRSTAEWYLS